MSMKKFNDIINEAEQKKVKYAEQKGHEKQYALGMEHLITFVRKRILEDLTKDE